MTIQDKIGKYTIRGWYQRPVKDIKKITVHHTAVPFKNHKTKDADLKGIQAHHVGQGWPGVSYHYFIFQDGTVWQLNNLTDITWHDSINNDSIGVALHGYFHPSYNDKPTKKQLESLKELLDELTTEHPEFPADSGDVVGHRERKATACPGDLFFPYVKEYREKDGEVDWSDGVIAMDFDPREDITTEWEDELGLKDYEVYKEEMKRMNVEEIVKFADELYLECRTAEEHYLDELDDLREANGLELEKLNKGLHSISEALSEVDGDSSLEKVNYLLQRLSAYENIVENEEVNTDMTKKTFPEWKKAIIEGRRVFILALLAELAVVIPNAPLLAEVNNWNSILSLLVIPVITGAAKAVLKWAQEKYGQGDYSKLIYKV